jgi:RNA polymerase sigma-70 factor (ECF subfamily)
MFDHDCLNRLYRYALSMAKDRDLAYDLLHSSLEKMLSRNMGQIDNPTHYIMRVIRNEFIDVQRRNRRAMEIFYEPEQLPNIIDIKSDLDLQDMAIHESELAWLLTQLSPQEGELLYLWAVEEYTIDEIAALLGTARGTLLSRLSRLKKRIRANAQDGDEQTRKVNTR